MNSVSPRARRISELFGNRVFVHVVCGMKTSLHWIGVDWRSKNRPYKYIGQRLGWRGAEWCIYRPDRQTEATEMRRGAKKLPQILRGNQPGQHLDLNWPPELSLSRMKEDIRATSSHHIWGHLTW